MQSRRNTSRPSKGGHLLLAGRPYPCQGGQHACSWQGPRAAYSTPTSRLAKRLQKAKAAGAIQTKCHTPGVVDFRAGGVDPHFVRHRAVRSRRRSFTNRASRRNACNQPPSPEESLELVRIGDEFSGTPEWKPTNCPCKILRDEHRLLKSQLIGGPALPAIWLRWHRRPSPRPSPRARGEGDDLSLSPRFAEAARRFFPPLSARGARVPWRAGEGDKARATKSNR